MATNVMKEDDESAGSGIEEITIVEKLPESDEDRRAHIDDEDERDIDPEHPDGDINEEEREAIRERRRLEKQERKERRDQAIKRDKTELEFLRKRNDDLERRLTGVEQHAQQVNLSTYDANIQKALQEVDMAEKVIAKAVEAGNGADVTQAMRYRDQALARAQQLDAAKRQAQQVSQQSANQIDGAVMEHAREFLGENKWYDPQGRDEDSAIVLAIDQALVKDGYDPRSADYWDELRRRAARRLPERFNAARNSGREERTPRGGPAVGSGREHAPTSTRKEVYISPERKQALIDAGVWDDPVLRMKYVKRYAEYDRNSRA
jgi:hypothetical protein